MSIVDLWPNGRLELHADCNLKETKVKWTVIRNSRGVFSILKCGIEAM